MFKYVVETSNLCEAQELFIEYGCMGGRYSCPDHVFIFDAEFKDELPPDILKHYNSKKDFSIIPKPAT